MAIKERWWKNKISEQADWFENYPMALEKYRDALKVTDGELLQAQKDAAMFKYLIDYCKKIKQHYKDMIKYKKTVLSGNIQINAGKVPVFISSTSPLLVLTGLLIRTFSFIITLKFRDGYNDVIGAALGVIGADPEFFDPDKYVANGNAALTRNGIRIKFKKGKYISGMIISCRRGDDPEFYYLTTITSGRVGFLDDRSNLIENVWEERTYRTRAVIGNDKIGGSSPEFKITCLILPPPVKKEEEKSAEENNTDL